MTKEEASDLKSLIQRKVQTVLDLQRAKYADEDATRDIDQFLWSKEMEAKKKAENAEGTTTA